MSSSQSRSGDFDMSVQPSRSAGIRLAAAVGAKLVLSAVTRRPLADAGAEAIVRSPNAQRIPPPLAPGELRIDVGPPAATLSLAVLDCANPRATIFVLHGIRDSKESLLGWGRMLTAAAPGHSEIVLIDGEGHGSVAGAPATRLADRATRWFARLG